MIIPIPASKFWYMTPLVIVFLCYIIIYTTPKEGKKKDTIQKWVMINKALEEDEK